MRILFIAMLSAAVLLGACSKKTNAPQQAPVASSSQQKFAPVVSQTVPPQNNAPTPMNTLIAPLSPDAAKSNDRILSQVTFVCSNKLKFTATFKPSEVDIDESLHGMITIPQVISASGFWYKNAQYELRGKGSTAQWTAGKKAPVICNASH